MRRRKEIREVAAAAEEVGVRMTRARAEEEVDVRYARARAAEVNKRKVSGEELSCCSSSVVQLKRRRRIAVTTENSDDPCASLSSDHALSPCSSSNASSELAKEKLTTIDLKEEDEEASSVEIATSATYNIDRKERRETTPLSELQAESAELESTTVMPSEANSRRRSAPVKIPSDAELEDFFSAAEKDIQKQFAQKYNFDIVKEEPLEGRYTWIRVKP